MFDVEMVVSSLKSLRSAGDSSLPLLPAFFSRSGARSGVGVTVKETVVSVWFSAKPVRSGSPGGTTNVSAAATRAFLGLASVSSSSSSSDAAAASSKSSSSSSSDAPSESSSPGAGLRMAFVGRLAGATAAAAALPAPAPAFGALATAAALEPAAFLAAAAPPLALFPAPLASSPLDETASPVTYETRRALQS